MDNKFLAAGGILAIAATIGLSEIDTTKTVDSVKLTPVQEIATKQVGQEITSLRTENKEVFKAPAGKLQAKIYVKPKYYYDSEEAAFKEQDLTVKEVSTLAKLNPLKQFDKYVDAGNYKAVWLESSPNNYTLYGSDDNYIGYTALFESKSVSGQTVQQFNGMKQTWTIADSSVKSLSWMVKSDLRLVAAGKSVIGRDEYNKDKMTISEPVAWDAGGVTVPLFVYLNADTLKYAVFPPKGCVWPVTIDPTTTVTRNAGNSGRILVDSSVSFAGARDATSGTAVLAYYGVGMADSVSIGGSWRVIRSFLSFPIPPVSTVSACSLYCYGGSDASTTDFNLKIYGARSYGSTLDSGDYNKFNGWAASGSYTGTTLNNTWNSSSYSATWNKFVFNAAGLDSVKAAASDTLRIALVSEEDVNNSKPTTNEYVVFNEASYNAYISMTYTVNPVVAGSFKITPISKDSLNVTWTGITSTNDSLRLTTYPDSAFVAYLTVSANSARIGGLNPYTKYKWRIKSVASGGSLYSNADSNYTTQEFKTENINLVNSGTAFANSVASSKYDSVRVETKADSIDVSGSRIGQQKSGANYFVYRQYFDIIIPKLTKVQAETLYVKGAGDDSDTDFFIKAISGFWTGGTAAKSKYFTFDGWKSTNIAYTGIPLTDSLTTSGFSAAGDNKLVFNSAGKDSTKAASGDTLQISILSNRDIFATTPTGNEYITTDLTAGNSYLKITYAPPDTAPASFTITAISKDSLLAAWVDKSHSERGFIVIDETTGNKIAGTDTTNAGVQSLRIGGFYPNRGYGMKVKAVGGAADGLTSAADSCYTLPAVPVISPLTFLADSILKVNIDTTGTNNPSYTEYALQDSSTGKFIKLISGIDSFSTDTTWATYNTWGATGGDTVRAGVGKKYYMRIIGRSGQ